MSKAVRYFTFRSLGIDAISFNSPSKYLRLSIISWFQRPRALRSFTRNGLRTMNSPERLDLTNRFLYVGSMQGLVAVMFEIVAVGAIARQLELRMPCFAILARNGSQLSLPPRGTSTGTPRSFSRRSSVSCGKRPRSHFEPLYVEYVPRSAARSDDAS